MPNMKMLLQNYETELKKKIVFQVCKNNVAMDKRLEKQKKGEKVEEKERDDSNENKLMKICNSLRISTEVRRKFLGGQKIKQLGND